MLEGTEREVLELLSERPRSPTEVADELGVSVQTASRNLKRLVEQEFAKRTQEGEGRGYKQYRAREFARVFAGYDGALFEETLSLSDEKRAVLSTWKVPQEEFHPYLMSYLGTPDWDHKQFHVTAIVVYGSVARGDAQVNSDIDILLIHADDQPVSSGESEYETSPGSKSFSVEAGFARDTFEKRVVSEEWFTITEFRDALDAGSQFLRNVLDEGIVLYDPEGVIRDARRERTGERVPQ
jgi:predicted nucleotidyltransferase/biotin operon repressor